MDLIWADPDDRAYPLQFRSFQQIVVDMRQTIFFMPISNLEGELAASEDIIVRPNPARYRCQFRSRNSRDRTEEQPANDDNHGQQYKTEEDCWAQRAQLHQRKHTGDQRVC